MKIVKLVTINLLVFFFLLFLLELGFRLFWKMGTLEKEIYQTSANKTLRYQLKPNLDTLYEDSRLMTNSANFRGKEYDFQKPSHTYRILLLGDSVAFGRHLNAEDLLSTILEDSLGKECPEKSFEVLNMGVEGYNTLQELELLKAKGLKYHPDLLIVYYCFNDPNQREYYFKKNFINRHSVLARYVLYRFKKRMAKMDRQKRGIKSIPDDFRYLYQECPDCWKVTKSALIEMADLAQQEEIPMVLLIAVEMSQDVLDFREGYPFWYINELLEGLKHENLTVVDPLRDFSEKNLEKEEVNIQSYPDRRANEIIAAYLIKKLKENSIFFCQ